MKPDPIILQALNSLSLARESFKRAIEEKLILGNDNHIGDIGEYWVRKHFETNSNFKEYAPKKNSPYDIELITGETVSVKTITAWSESGYGTQIKPLCGTHWKILAAVLLNKELFPEKIALVEVGELLNHEPFKSNIMRRNTINTSAHPRFQWWEWLDKYVVYKHV